MAYQEDNGPPLFTYAMIATYLAVFAAEFAGAGGLDYLMVRPWLLGRGETWRLLSATLMHASVIHLLFNLYWFARFSLVIENWLGPWFALALYVFCAAGSSAAQVLIGTPSLVGASGVVYGFFGFLWVLRRRRDDAASVVDQSTIQYMLAWLVVCFVVNLFGAPIANTAHVVGLGLGRLVGQCFVARRKERPLLVAATLAIGLTLPLLTWQPVWEHTLAYVPVLSRTYRPQPAVEKALDEYRAQHRRPPGLF
jgi:GlpG protein